jgi:hypothetical protein
MTLSTLPSRNGFLMGCAYVRSTGEESKGASHNLCIGRSVNDSGASRRAVDTRRCVPSVCRYYDHIPPLPIGTKTSD